MKYLILFENYFDNSLYFGCGCCSKCNGEVDCECCDKCETTIYDDDVADKEKWAGGPKSNHDKYLDYLKGLESGRINSIDDLDDLDESISYKDNEKHKQEVIEFSKMYLAELIDEGNINIIVEDTGLRIWRYMVKVLLGVGRDMKTWGSIKDQLIPYLKMFVRECGQVSNITVLGRTSIDTDTITYDKFIEDDYIEDDYKVRAIKFLF